MLFNQLFPPALAIIIVATLTATDPAAGDVPSKMLHGFFPAAGRLQGGAQVGYSIAADGNFTVVGAPYDDFNGSDSGAVKVFDSATGALLHVISDSYKGNHFGRAVSISGSRLAVGTSGGKVYIYDLAGVTPLIPIAILTNPQGVSGNYGSSVSISGTRIVVGDSTASLVGRAYMYDLDSATPSTPVATVYGFGSTTGRFGFAVAISGTKVLIGDPLYLSGGLPVGQVYVYDFGSTSPKITITNPNPGPRAPSFGNSVSLSGTRFVVGAPGRIAGGFQGGGAYVYNLTSATSASLIATLNNPNPADGDFFGAAVAIADSTVIVGATYDDAGAPNAGSAYVYDLTSATPTTPTLSLANPTPANGDAFGGAVAASGTHFAIGANFDDTGATDAGSAYLYDLNSSTPSTPSLVLNHPGPAVSEYLGRSVAISGSRVVVGANGDDTGASDAGIVSVYDLSSATPNVPAFVLNNPSPASNDDFGWSVAISGSLVVVGTPSDGTGATWAGSVYVFDLSGGTPTLPVATLNNPAPGAGDFFGWSVGIDGTRIVVGARQDDTGATDAGSAYVYDLSSATPTVPLATLTKPTPQADDFFGCAVGISGARVIVGAENDDTGASSAGSAYLFDLNNPTPTTPAVILNNPAPHAGDYFGEAVAISGSRVAVGAPGDDTGASSAGTTYVYDLDSATPAPPVTTLHHPNPAAAGLFGQALAISGTQLTVGAPYADLDKTNSGAVYVFDLAGVSPTVPVAELRNPSPAVDDQFGMSVASNGTTVVVGAPYDDTTDKDEGAAYIFGPNPNDPENNGLLDSWELNYWSSTTGHSALDDSDHDGACELLELAFGLNPTLPDAATLPSPVDENGYLTMTIARQAGVTYEVQSAGTLQPAQPDSFSASSTTVLINNATTLKVRDNFLLNTSPGRFMRVKVTAVP